MLTFKVGKLSLMALEPFIIGRIPNIYGYIHRVKDSNRKRRVYCVSLHGYIESMDKSAEKAQALLGQRIRSLRNEKKWTLEALGEIAATNDKHIGEIERGLQNPSFAVLVKIAEALGVDLPELVRFEQEGLSRKQIEREITDIVKSISDESLKQIHSVLRVLYPMR